MGLQRKSIKIVKNSKNKNMKTLQELQPLILEWAKERDLIKLSNAPKQKLKLIEEAGELANAILKNNIDEQKDALGDMFVVLIILSEQQSNEIIVNEFEKYEKPFTEIYEALMSIVYLRNVTDIEIVWLHQLSIMLNHDLTECANLAYETIKNRTGKTVNGTFIKD